MEGDQRLAAAYRIARDELLSQRVGGHWIGELANSALSTATAMSALSLVDRDQYQELIARGAAWLARRQNEDGGWGDTDRSYSNVATTMLVQAAVHLSGRDQECSASLGRAVAYIEKQGGLAALRRRYGQDKTFAVPILTNAALARLVSWREVSALPFELACFPQSWYRFLRMPVVSYAIPALVAIGQAKYFLDPPGNPLTRICRKWAIGGSLDVLRRMQPASGGYLEAVPLTSFVVMSLAATGRREHAVVRDGVRFLVDSVRDDGGWPIDTNLATWNTSLALQALALGGEALPDLPGASACLDWLLSCQHRMRHPFTGADPGGWGWSDLSGAVPDADDTPAALLVLARWHGAATCTAADRKRIESATVDGLRWLLDLQNSDGGWPTFCRGWGKLPFDRSGADLTAHALRALHAWRGLAAEQKLSLRFDRARQRGLAYLARSQRADGSWVPLWFGNQDHPAEENPVYGTAKVLLAYRDLGLASDRAAQRGREWLARQQSPGGSWGSGGCVEETALAVEALVGGAIDRTLSAGLDWLLQAVETSRYLEPSPIGFYFAKLWYYEKLYPVTFVVSALGSAHRQTSIPPANPVRQCQS